jgi:putative tryptophan/tyrosine transport system substrate-binding protein
MHRRRFIALLGTAICAARTLRAQQKAMPVIGFLHQGPLEPAPLLDAFSQGLNESGISVAHDARIEHRAADGHYERLPALAKELVDLKVVVIAANFLPAALAAKAATQTIPIVFLSGSDPVAAGLVSSFNRPNGNVTGIASMFTQVGSKNLQLLHELVPQAVVVGVLMNQTNPSAAPQVTDLQAAAPSLGLQLEVFGASTPSEIDEAFAKLAQRRIGALVVTADGFLRGRQDQLVALAAHYAVPTIYPFNQYVTAGGLISYGASLADGFYQTGIYVGKILKGATPAELPVMQPTKFDLLINLKTANALGLTVPAPLLDLAEEVIE